MGPAGAMAFDTMSANPVLGAPGQDVVSMTVVLLMACLKKKRRGSNLFTQQEDSRLSARERQPGHQRTHGTILVVPQAGAKP
ncbi:unnamed protein product [Ectocarpus sp. 13 AM-2016]